MEYPVVLAVETGRASRGQRRFVVKNVPAHLRAVVEPEREDVSAALGWLEFRWTITASSRSRAESELERVARLLARRVEHDVAFARAGLRRATSARSAGASADGGLWQAVRIG
jgi:hypothetical protein